MELQKLQCFTKNLGGEIMKAQKTKLVSLLLAGMMVVMACGENDTNSATNDSGNNEETVQIQFMHTSVEEERLRVIDGLVEKFESENTDVEIEQVVVEESNLNTNIITLASSGQLPEVVEVGQDYARVMDKDELIDREAVGNVLNNVGTDNYYEGALKLLRTEEGESYTGVPLSGWVQGIWYNKEMLESEGFSSPSSWEEVLEVAESFTDADNREYGIALPTVESNYSEQAFSQFALSNNANVLDGEGNLTANTPEMTEALSFYQELSQYTMPGSNDTTEVRDAFMNGSSPMAIYSTYILPTIFNEGDPENVGFAIPTNKTEAVYGTVTSLTITSALEDQKREAAERFVEFMADVENTTEWILMAPGGAQPVHKGVVENETYTSNEVVNAFGELSSEIAESFNDIQVFGLVDEKNFVVMGDITSSGAIPAMVNSVTVGGLDVESEIEKAESTLSGVVD